jgi:hypothetical protein
MEHTLLSVCQSLNLSLPVGDDVAAPNAQHGEAFKDSGDDL